MKKYYLKDLKSLAIFKERATAEFWDEHWKIDNLAEYVRSYRADGIFIPQVMKYLPSGAKILDGGCGRGQLVHALHFNGFKAIGIDFAERTVNYLNEKVPELDIRFGSVADIPIGDGELDGYISAGVIEHYWDGYDKIISEMSRTIKKGGYLFLSFPYMSPLRKIKVFLKSYSTSEVCKLDDLNNIFYQFELNHKRVIKELNKFNFEFIKKMPFDGIKGLKDEINFLKPLLQKIYDGKMFLRSRYYIDVLFRSFASHCVLLIMKRI